MKRKPQNEIVDGQPIRCYDNGGASFDRYTVAYVREYRPGPGYDLFSCVGMSGSPFHPQGFGQHSECMLGRHLGKRIAFAALPADCQKLVHQDLTPEAK